MKIRIGTACKSRRFSKAIRSLRPAFESFSDSFSLVGMNNPVYEALLLGITDSLPRFDKEEIKNRESHFQILIGVGNGDDFASYPKAQQLEIVSQVFRIAIVECPFSEPDQRALLRLHENFNWL